MDLFSFQAIVFKPINTVVHGSIHCIYVTLSGEKCPVC